MDNLQIAGFIVIIFVGFMIIMRLLTRLTRQNEKKRGDEPAHPKNNTPQDVQPKVEFHSIEPDIRAHPKNNTPQDVQPSETINPSQETQPNKNLQLHSGARNPSSATNLPETVQPYNTVQQWQEPDSDTFDYDSPEWVKLSYRIRKERGWKCEICEISLAETDNKYYLHTHHIFGTQWTQRTDDKNLQVLCIACHSEQFGDKHLMLKMSNDYRGYMIRYGRRWGWHYFDLKKGKKKQR